MPAPGGPSPRVVSLLPSATEILCAVGGRALLVGRSHECDFPPGIDHLPILTAATTRYVSAADVDRQVRESLASDPAPGGSSSLYTLDTGLLESLRPDVILTQDLCHVCSIDLAAVRQVADRLSPRPAIISLNPLTVEGVLDDLLTVGNAVGLQHEAESALVALRERMYRAMDHVNPYADGPSIAFLEWPDPLFIGGHWTPQLIERAGGRHPLNPTVPGGTGPSRVQSPAGAAVGPIGLTLRSAAPSRTISPDQLLASRPDALILCPCGLGLDRTRREFDALRQKPWWPELHRRCNGRIALVDGNQMFNRPGPRLIDALEWLVAWLNDRPELTPAGFPWEPRNDGRA